MIENQLQFENTRAKQQELQQLYERKRNETGDAHAVRKAWLFGLLFAITREHDPHDRFGSSVLPNNRSLDGGWEIWGGSNEENLPGTISFPSFGSSGSGKIDPKAQQELTNTWVKWMKSVKVALVQ